MEGGLGAEVGLRRKRKEAGENGEGKRRGGEGERWWWYKK